MNICLLSQEWPPFGCGIGTYMYNLARGLVQFGHHVTVITHDRSPVQLSGVTLCSVPLPVSNGSFLSRGKRKLDRLFGGIVHKWSWNAYKKFEELLQSQQVDIIETADFGAWGWHFVNNGKVPVAVRCHTPSHVLHAIAHGDSSSWPMSNKSRDQDYFERMQTVRADGISSPSEALAYHLSLSWSIPLPRFTVIPNLIDTELFCPSPDTNPSNEILYVGRLDLFKGVYDLTQSVIPILERFPDVSVHFVGMDRPAVPEYGMKGNTASEAILSLIPPQFHDRVHFTAHVQVSEIVKFQQLALCAVMPTRGFESFSYTVLEPMACGTPVIATRCGGPSEIITHGVDGLLVPPGKPQALTDAMMQLLQSPEQRSVLAANARRTVEQQYAFSAVIPRIIEWYEEVIREFKR